MISKNGEPFGSSPTEKDTPAVQIPAKWVFLLKSRKFWAALVALGLVIFRAYHPDFPIDDANLTQIILVIIAYIVGTAFEDAATKQVQK